MQTRFITKVSLPAPLWRELNTVTTFDSGSGERLDDMNEKHVAIKNFKLFPSSLLVESLLEHLCKHMDEDPANQKNLYKNICSKLHKMKLIDNTYELKEFETLRSTYLKALLHFMAVAKSDVENVGDSNPGSIMKLPLPNLEFSTSVFRNEQILHWSRYLIDYVELEFIAGGGFGQVYKVRHKLDGEEYAVKKIYLRCRNLKSFMDSIREVKLLAKLNHPNIVSYKAAWLEPLYVVNHNAQDDDCEDNSPDVSSVSEQDQALNSYFNDESSSIIFKHSHSKTTESSALEKECESSYSSSHKTKNKNVHSEELKFSFGVQSYINSHSRTDILESCEDYERNWENYTEEEAVESGKSEDRAVCNYALHGVRSNEWSNCEPEWAVLFIQMQLCQSTLRTWLDERNAHVESEEIDLKRALNIFHNIVQGVAYIHSQEIVHHDIKPSNIFVSGKNESEVQVGDFGLACFLRRSSDNVMLIRHDHEGEIGTRLYAAPEQVEGKCNMKSDVFSLGIILLELLHPFKTGMERSKVLSQVRDGILPTKLSRNLPQMVPLITALLSPQPENRPSAETLLVDINQLLERINNDNVDTLFLSSNETVESLLAELNRKEQEIEELKRKVYALQSCK